MVLSKKYNTKRINKKTNKYIIDIVSASSYREYIKKILTDVIELYRILSKISKKVFV